MNPMIVRKADVVAGVMGHEMYLAENDKKRLCARANPHASLPSAKPLGRTFQAVNCFGRASPAVSYTGLGRSFPTLIDKGDPLRAVINYSVC